MQLKRQERSICCLFILILLFLGICTDHIQADSSFLYAESDFCRPEDSFSSSLHPMESTAPMGQLFVPDSVRRCELTLSPRPGKSDRNGSYSLCFPPACPKHVSYFYASAICISHEAASNAVIICYIHRQDGQKG